MSCVLRISSPRRATTLTCTENVRSNNSGHCLKYFVGLFIVNKRVHFVVVVCLVHNNSHPSLVCGQYDYVLVCFQSFKCFLFVRKPFTVLRCVLISKHMFVYIKNSKKAKISILPFIVINLLQLIQITFTFLFLIYSKFMLQQKNTPDESIWHCSFAHAGKLTLAQNDSWLITFSVLTSCSSCNSTRART